MNSQFFAAGCAQIQVVRRFQKVGFYASIGLLAMLAVFVGSPAAAQDGASQPTPTTKVAWLKAFPLNTSTAELGTPIATNYNIYCGKEGTLTTPNPAEPERSICSVGGVIEDSQPPLVEPEAQPLLDDNYQAKPIVLQQYDKTQLFPR